MRGDKCQRQEKLVPRARNITKYNAKNMSKIRTLGEHLLQVKGVKLKRNNGTRLSDDEREDERLYNELKAWKTTSIP